MNENDKFVIVYDTDLRRPACVLLQVAMGGDRSAFNRYFGGASNWLVSPTPGMKRIAATDAEWRHVAEKYRSHD